jgi:hypothetical protein
LTSPHYNKASILRNVKNDPRLAQIIQKEVFCEHGNDPSGSIKGAEILDQLSDYRLLEETSTT